MGDLKPNELGLFDMLGNGWQWCNDAGANGRAPPPGGSVDDSPESTPVYDRDVRTMRGAGFKEPGANVQCAGYLCKLSGDRFFGSRLPCGKDSSRQAERFG